MSTEPRNPKLAEEYAEYIFAGGQFSFEVWCERYTADYPVVES